MMKLTYNQAAVLKYLRDDVIFGGWARPTPIGAKAGGRTVRGFLRHSAWASPILKAMVLRGYAERREPGWYRITKGGIQALYDDIQWDIKGAEVRD